MKKINLKDFLLAKFYFGKNFCENLKKIKSGTFKESLFARYLIEKNRTKGDFFSISHKKNLVFVGINNKKIGVDIENFILRDESILEKFNEKEYEILGGKNWKNFYVLWTAKEAIIKFANLKLDDMEKIFLKNFEKINKKITEISFDKKLNFSFENKNFLVYNGNNKKNFYSICE